MKTALLIIDLQNDFTRKNGKVPACTHQIPAVIDSINLAIKERSQKKEPLALITTRWSNPITRLLTRDSVKPGTYGAELDDRLLYSNNVAQFVKKDKDIFSSPELLQWLKQHDIESLILSGLAVEHCLMTSAQSALKRGFSVHLLADGVASYKCKGREKGLAKMQKLGITTHETTFQ